MAGNVEFVDNNLKPVTPQAPQQKSLDELFSVPKEEVRIPSNGLVYSQTSGLCNSRTVEMRYMTTGDEDIMISPTLVRQGTWLTKLISACMMNKGINPDKMLVGDRNALLFWLRQTAYGSDYDLKVLCPSCGKNFNHVFKLDKLILKTLDVKPIAEGVNEFDFVLPISKIPVKFSLMTGEMDIEYTREVQEQTKSGNTSQERLASGKIIKQLTEIAGVRDKKQIERFVHTRMLAKDSMALRDYIEEITPDIIQEQQATCPECGASNKYSVPLEMQFFWPQSRPR
jgi:rRNA maturation protein Nop10